MTDKRYDSLAELRADKEQQKSLLVKDFERLKLDTNEYYRPSDSMFVNSTSGWLNAVGYVIAAYRGVTSVRSAVKFLSKLL